MNSKQLQQRIIRCRAEADGVSALLKGKPKKNQQALSAEMTEDPCAAERLAYLQSLLTELQAELVLLNAQMATMTAMDALMVCESNNEDPPDPEAP